MIISRSLSFGKRLMSEPKKPSKSDYLESLTQDEIELRDIFHLVTKE